MQRNQQKLKLVHSINRVLESVNFVQSPANEAFKSIVLKIKASALVDYAFNDHMENSHMDHASTHKHVREFRYILRSKGVGIVHRLKQNVHTIMKNVNPNMLLLLYRK